MACITYVSDGGSNVVGIEASIDDMPRAAKAEGVFLDAQSSKPRGTTICSIHGPFSSANRDSRAGNRTGQFDIGMYVTTADSQVLSEIETISQSQAPSNGS
jgi:hypothetical protein